MAFYLQKTGRQIFLSCEYPDYQLHAGQKVCHFVSFWQALGSDKSFHDHKEKTVQYTVSKTNIL